jgi:hypothetical protein
MTGETNEGARRVRVVPRQGPGSPTPGPGPAAAGPGAPRPLDAETDVLPRVDPGLAPPPPGPPAPRDRSGRPPGPPPPLPGPPPAPAPAPVAPAPDDEAAAAADGERRGRATGDDAGTPDKTERRNGMGTPALVLGVLAAGTCWTGWAGVVLGLFGAAAGYLGARRAWRGLATDGAASLGGLTLGVIGLVVGVVIVWPTLFGTGNFGDGLTLDQCLQQANGAFEMHMCKSQHITEFNQRFPNAAT